MGLSLAEKLKTYIFNIWFLWGLTVILNIITFLFLYFKIHPGNKILTLHYNVLIGAEWYGKGKNLYFIPIVGIIITAVNFALYRAFRKSGGFLSDLTVFASLCAQIVLLAAVLFLAKVN
jgi:hypothetical protein